MQIVRRPVAGGNIPMLPVILGKSVGIAGDGGTLFASIFVLFSNSPEEASLLWFESSGISRNVS
jgi:hypothetical protein